jgi:hypothetical protein
MIRRVCHRVITALKIAYRSREELDEIINELLVISAARQICGIAILRLRRGKMGRIIVGEWLRFFFATLPNPNIGIFGGLGLYPQDGTFYTDVVTTLTSVKNNFGRKCNNITLGLFI